MLPKSLKQAHDERAFTLIELLVVILIIGILAAIAIPSFLNQQHKGQDSEAKAAVVTAAKAMEACATDTNGSYTSCTKPSLLAIEPTLNDAGSRLSVNPGAKDYEIVVTSNRDGGAASFTLSRSTNSTTTRSCDTGSADKGGCQGGTW
jgi:type IV pilus assembly protein PilA